MKWETLICSLSGSSEAESMKLMDSAGEEGWEPFAVSGSRVFFKRPVEDTPPWEPQPGTLAEAEAWNGPKS